MGPIILPEAVGCVLPASLVPKMRLRNFLTFVIQSIGAVDEGWTLNEEMRARGENEERSKAAACYLSMESLYTFTVIVNGPATGRSGPGPEPGLEAPGNLY